MAQRFRPWKDFENTYVENGRGLENKNNICYLNVAVNFLWSHSIVFREQIVNNLTDRWREVVAAPFLFGNNSRVLSLNDAAVLELVQAKKDQESCEYDCLKTICRLIEKTSEDEETRAAITADYTTKWIDESICTRCGLRDQKIRYEGLDMSQEETIKLGSMDRLISARNNKVHDHLCVVCNQRTRRKTNKIAPDNKWIRIYCGRKTQQKKGQWNSFLLGGYTYYPYSAIISNEKQSHVTMALYHNWQKEYHIFDNSKEKCSTKLNVKYAIQLIYMRSEAVIQYHLDVDVIMAIPRKFREVVEKQGLTLSAKHSTKQFIEELDDEDRQIILDKAHDNTTQKGVLIGNLIRRLKTNTGIRYERGQVNRYIRHNLQPPQPN